MTQQVSKEKKLKSNGLAATNPSCMARSYLAFVMPKIVAEKKLLTLPVYWLLPTDTLLAQLNEGQLPSPVVSILKEILTESLLEDLWLSSIDNLSPWLKHCRQAGFSHWAEKQFLPGVTDNLAHIVEEALSMQNLSFKVASGSIYLARGVDGLQDSEYRLYHPLIERFQIHDLKSLTLTQSFTFPAVIPSKPSEPEIVDLAVSNEQLVKISRERILALTIEEMQAIKHHYTKPEVKEARTAADLSNWPSDVELEIIAQTWSEHCKHKIFNANIIMEEVDTSGHVETKTIKSLYQSFIQKATKELQGKRKDLLSVFKDNSGVVKWNDQYAVCFKVETHNSPSALEPYGGALTGILGVNRDILGTGLGARPIFNTDILCFAYPSDDLPKRPKLLPPAVIMAGVRKGIQDGGNKSGIPTVNGAIVFNSGYRAKPLVFCGTGGLLPLKVAGLCAYEKHTCPGDIVVMAGGRVGKDGIHGATFSSEALHEGSPVNAVQIGDPFTQKRLLDFILAARDVGLISGITDNGAGGLSSSVGEMANLTGGVKIDLDHVPTKYPGLASWEIIVSESQERMTISTNNFIALQELANKYHVEVSAIGEFNCSGKFEIVHRNKLVASLDLEFLHNGVPELNLPAYWQQNSHSNQIEDIEEELQKADIKQLLLKILAHPNVCNRESVIRQYDHEVQGTSVIKPLMGANQISACDAAVITPILGESLGLVISNGLCPQLSQFDPYLMAQAALDEAIRNAVCVGADPNTISILDNFCWPDPIASANNLEGKTYLGMLVKACQGLYDAALAMETPLISGKDSMKNDFDDGVIRLSIPPTLLISAMGKVPDINHCLTSDFKNAGDQIFLLSAGTLGLAGSVLSEISNAPAIVCSLNLEKARLLYQNLHQAIMNGWINSAHDISDGGLAANLAESIIGSGLGAKINLQRASLLFAEGPGQIVITVAQQNKERLLSHFAGDSVLCLGEVKDSNLLEVVLGTEDNRQSIKWTLNELRAAWDQVLPFA